MDEKEAEARPLMGTIFLVSYNFLLVYFFNVHSILQFYFKCFFLYSASSFESK